ncbi:tetratricopeptide repeat protein [Aporhodopirellula aestuarii]|uniref:tetratricopeptide repeat protein n=1 Tax=Aporhodopirellula aestuarii TaxID=2950107 RepID=UPI003898F8C7
MYGNHLLWVGKGIAQDSSLAAIWFEKAAAQGFDEAKYKLGILYSNGDGVEQDREKAFELSCESEEKMETTHYLFGDGCYC